MSERERPRIVLIEDEPAIADAVVYALSAEGFEVIRARGDKLNYNPSGQRPKTVKGTGLGLSFVKEIAELHGGSVTLNNGTNAGAIASMRLPMQKHPV